MIVALLRYLAMTVGPAITAAARPALTFFAIQVTVATLVSYDMASLPPRFAWLISVPAMTVALVVAALNTAAQHDPDVAAIARDLHIDRVTGGLSTLSAALLFAALGLPESMSGELATGATQSVGLLEAVSQAATGDRSAAAELAAVGGALLINLFLTHLRIQFLTILDDFELSRLWARVETGGTLGLLIVLPLLPLVAFGFLVVFALGLALLALTMHAAAEAVDAHLRIPCEHCDYELRPEASLCPECHTVRTPTAEPRSGLSAALATLGGKSEPREPDPQ